MPGDISRDSSERQAYAPYIPPWCYKDGPRLCPCGHHEGYHDDDGICLHQQACGCAGLPDECLTPLEEM